MPCIPPYTKKDSPYSLKDTPFSNKENPYTLKDNPFSNKTNPYSDLCVTQVTLKLFQDGVQFVFQTDDRYIFNVV